MISYLKLLLKLYLKLLFNYSVDLIRLFMCIIYILQVENIFSIKRAQCLVTLYINYHIIVVPRIIDRRYIDSSVRSTESRLSYPAEPTLSDTSINPTILKLSHQHDEPLERFCSRSSVEEKNARTILLKKKI